MVRRAVETEIDGEGHARPGRVARTAVEADLVGLLALELAEQRMRLGLGRESHVCLCCINASFVSEA